jgi:hypothetical protein
MSSAGRVANLSGCVASPGARAIGLIGFAAQTRRSSPTGSCVMEAAEHREPCEPRGSRTVHPVKRTSTDALLIATGASALAFASSAQAGAPFSCDPTFEPRARAPSGDLDHESKTWIIDTARRFYQDRSRDFPDMPPIGELRVQSIAGIAGCAPRI